MQISHVRMRVFDAVSRGLDVTLIVPERRVRAAVTRSLREHFGDSGWNVVALDAHKSFQAVPLLPLATAGVVDSQDLRVQSVGPAIDALAARLTKNPRRSVVVVADGQWLDPLTCGAILTATARADVAVVTVQSTAPDEPPADGILIELPHLDRADFAEAVEAHTGLRLGSASLSRLRTSTGARLDLAVAVVHAARWNGGLRALAGGEQRLVGRLWTPELRPTLERELEDIDARTRGVLESIALRGGIRSEELADALGTDRLRELEREGRIELAPDRDGPVVLVTPPLMAEHLRMTAPRVRLESIDDTGSLAAPSRWDPRVHRSVLEQASTLVRAHKERALHRVHDARAVWARANGALPAATELLRACTAVDGHEREIGRLLAETDTARGAPDERADWIDARWTYEAWCRGVLPDVGAEDLADLPACARVRLHLREKELSHALLVHLDEEELDRLVREVEEDGRPEYAVRARFLAASAAVQRFDFDAAQAHLDHIRSQSACPRGMLLFLEALVALGRGDLAAVRTSIAEGFAGQSCELDLREAAAFAMLTVTLSVIGAPIVQSEEAIELASLFGIPVPSASNPFHALALSAIALTAWDPHHGHVLRFVHVEEPDALPAGPLRDLLAAWTETLREGADAGECLVALVPRLWDAGARFSATGVATVLTDMDMSPSDLMELAGWFRRAPGAVAGAYAAYAEARAVGDGAGLLAVAETFDALELDGQATRAIRGAVQCFAASGDDEGRARAESALSRRHPTPLTVLGDLTVQAPSLSRRERVIAGMASSGMSNREIATALGISVRTVESHVLRIMRKTGAERRVEIGEALTPWT